MTSNLKSRDLHGTEEHFFYDTDGKQLNRLAGTGPDEYTVSETYAFADNGNITEKQGVGEYFYHPDKKNAVTQIDIPELGQNQDLVQFVSYNHFNSASEIKNLDDQTRVDLEYGADDQRRVAKYWDESGAQDELIKTRLYAGAYEKQTNADLTEIEVHYISAGGQLAAMYVVENGVGSYYYPHQDHLGSIIHITDANGDVVYTQSFDPWGRTRNPSDLSYDNIPERPDWLWRGYTGHEHLDEFGLINMNGRLYDPVVGRMLSPDNYVQNPDFSQSYNRYSYVLNNPLKYTDPDGEWVHIVVGAVVGGVINLATNWNSIDNFGEGLAVFGAGAGAGALTAVNPFAGATLGGALTNATNNIVAQTGNGVGLGDLSSQQWGQVGVQALTGAVVGAASYGVGSAINSTGITNKLLDATNIGNNVARNIVGSTINGAVIGTGAGVVQGVATGVLTGDWNMWENVWKGAAFGAAGGALYGGLTELGYQAQLKWGRNKGLNSTNTETVANGGNDYLNNLKEINGTSGGESIVDGGMLGNRNGIGGVVVEVSPSGNVNVYYNVNAPGWQPIRAYGNYQNPQLYNQVIRALMLAR